MIITNIDINDLESIFSIQESVFKEEPLLTGLLINIAVMLC